MKMIQCCLTDFGNSCESPKCTKTAILESRRAHSEERRNSENQRKNIWRQVDRVLDADPKSNCEGWP